MLPIEESFVVNAEVLHPLLLVVSNIPQFEFISNVDDNLHDACERFSNLYLRKKHQNDVLRTLFFYMSSINRLYSSKRAQNKRKKNTKKTSKQENMK
jgi:hypothetical protein